MDQFVAQMLGRFTTVALQLVVATIHTGQADASAALACDCYTGSHTTVCYLAESTSICRDREMNTIFNSGSSLLKGCNTAGGRMGNVSHNIY